MADSYAKYKFTDEFKAKFIVVQKVPIDDKGDPTMTVEEWIAERTLMWLNEIYELGVRKDASNKVVYVPDSVSKESI